MQAPADYRESLLQFASAIRHPEKEAPAGVATRRMNVYRELFFNNMNSFLSSVFPVFKSLMADHWWANEVRGFMAYHRCKSPLFSGIGGEYLDYVNSSFRPSTDQDPPFMAELLHYEWLELTLEIAASGDLPRQASIDPFNQALALSPLARMVEYNFPVHQIGPGYQPTEKPNLPTWVLVYRDTEGRIQFMLLNAFSARLLALIQQEPDKNGSQLLKQIASECPSVDEEPLYQGGLSLLRQLHESGVLRVKP